MTDKELKLAIKKAIIDFGTATVHQAAISLFKTLGYNTERQNPLTHKSYDDFKESFLGTDSTFNEEKAYVKEWKSIDLLFQLTADEVSNQKSHFDTKQVDNTIIETYLFFSIELAKAEYNRTQLAQITREINKVFPMPVLIVFKHGETITLSVINRRLNKKEAQKDVLEKVTVIKDISTTAPHRAHIEILFDLSFSELLRVHKFTNFVELHNAWQNTLDTKELNKRFYRDLSNWYFWALQEVQFPTTNWSANKHNLMKEEEKVKEHNAKNLIRLLTRLLFVWFVKEKNLVPDELFDETYIKDNLLNGFEPRKKKGIDHKTLGSKYYRAILQNLFFATLNQTVGKREFRKDGQQMNVTNLMRYENYFKNPKKFIKLVEDTVPFMNGGLFECLDSPDPVLKGKKGGDVIVYEDGFSDRKDNTLCVPDYIFFGTGEHVDLSEELGDKKQKDVTVSGLINILKSYKFTVTENTPIEEDIALDPELLGRVFENLLASYNPETKTTARKQTGSFYTPREIVNYMVDESLKAYLKQKLETEAEMKSEDAEVGLKFLVGYNEKTHLFDDKQTAVLINAIDNCKILDPACGSGAFPMGILHKLVHILHKLDPNNKLWKERQIEKAQAIDDTEIRDKLIEDIETSFESNELDYGRKLYLIENCIYGVDIQPIATQISKLRFFISLIVDQKSNKSKDNFGIRPLPNLETKFVAANTLIGIEKPKQEASLFDNPKVKALESKLKDVRHRLFSAKTPKTKRELREKDQRIREEMGVLLVQSGWGNESAYQLSAWDPYNQNVSSGWFDSEWMFGIENGFDVVIGNPPYIAGKSGLLSDSDKKYFNKHFETAEYQLDTYILFTECGLRKLRAGGTLSYIMPNTWLANIRLTKIRKYLLETSSISEILIMPDDVFLTAVVDTTIIFCNKIYKPNNKIKINSFKEWNLTNLYEVCQDNYKTNDKYIIDIGINQNSKHLLSKIKKDTVPVSYLCDVNRGVHAYRKDGYGKSKFGKGFQTERDYNERSYHSTNKLDNTYYKEVRGKNVFPFYYELSDVYVSWGNWLAEARDWKYFEGERIYLRKIVGRTLFAAYVDSKNVADQSVYIAKIKKAHKIDTKYLLGILNSTLLTWYFRVKANEFDDLFPQIKVTEFKELPIKIVNTNLNGKLIEIVDKIISRKTEKPEIETTDLEYKLNQLVYKIYDLTAEEIATIEGSAK